MKYYKCNEIGCGGTEHDCASVKFVDGVQVCGAVQWQLDYCGHVFCAYINGSFDIDDTQLSFFESKESEY